MKTAILRFTATFFSIFSILSALSLIKEINRLEVEWYVALFLAIFLIVFVAFNEFTKVKELRLKFHKDARQSLMMLLVSFSISLATSGIGIWLWTDRSTIIENTIVEDMVERSTQISSTYNAKIDEIRSNPLTSYSEYMNALNSVYYWRNRTGIDKEDLLNIRNQISRAEQNLVSVTVNINEQRAEQVERVKKEMEGKLHNLSQSTDKKMSDSNRSNLITFIFFALIMITEFMIVVVQYELCNPNITTLRKEFNDVVRAVTYLHLRGFGSKPVDINEIKYCHFLKDYDWDKMKKLYNLLIEIGVLKSQSLYLSENYKECVDNYYKTMIKLM